MARRRSRQLQRLSGEAVGLFMAMEKCEDEAEFQSLQKQHAEIQWTLNGIKEPLFLTIAGFKDNISKRLHTHNGPMIAVIHPAPPKRSCEVNRRNLESIRWYIDRIDKMVSELDLPAAGEFNHAAENAKEAMSRLIISLAKGI